MGALFPALRLRPENATKRGFHAVRIELVLAQSHIFSIIAPYCLRSRVKIIKRAAFLALQGVFSETEFHSS
jgi:hypothetical protein